MKIESLSEAQLALIPQVRDEWLKICLDTAPVDRAKVRGILERLYAIANKPAPKHIIHLDSPLQLSNAIANMRLEGMTAYHEVSPEVGDQASYELHKNVIGGAVGPFRETFNVNNQDARISRQVYAQVEQQISDQVSFQANRVHQHARDAIADHGYVAISDEFLFEFVQYDHLLPSCDFYGRLGIDVSRLNPLFDLAKNCGWSMLFWDWAFISAKPEYIKRDEQQRLHCENGPALRYPDDFSVFAIHGIRVPERVVIAPKSITIPEIESETNVVVRRLMIERYGTERFLMDAGAKEIHRDDFGILYCKEFLEDQSLVMVKVVNSTPELDGSFKDYFLRVPPTMERARQAVAWTFGKEENKYSPACQT